MTDSRLILVDFYRQALDLLAPALPKFGRWFSCRHNLAFRWVRVLVLGATSLDLFVQSSLTACCRDEAEEGR